MLNWHALLAWIRGWCDSCIWFLNRIPFVIMPCEHPVAHFCWIDTFQQARSDSVYSGMRDFCSWRGRQHLESNLHRHQWSSGRIHRCHRCDPGSIPGWCIWSHLAAIFKPRMKIIKFTLCEKSDQMNFDGKLQHFLPHLKAHNLACSRKKVSNS